MKGGSPIALFLENLSIADDCWEWCAARNARGYGRLGNGKGGSMSAHRKSYELFVGPIPDKLHVLHTCDNPSCVNPRHLFLGTHQDNMLDMKNKGRTNARKGEKNGNKKLTEADVIEIRTSIKSSAQLASELGVTQTRICQIRKGNGWRHLLPATAA